MALWNYTLHLSDIWNDDEMLFQSKRDEIVRRIKTSRFYDLEWTRELEDAVECLQDSCGPGEWDYAFEMFYDYADTHRVWVDTF